MVQLSTEVHLIKAVCSAPKQRVGFTTSKTKKIHRNHFYWRSQHRANNRAQIFSSHTCVTTLKPFLRVPLSSVPTVFSERLSHCTGHLTRYSLRPTNSPRWESKCGQDSSVTLLLSILFLTIRQILISVQHQAVPAVAVCKQEMTLSPSLRGSLRMCTLQP